MARVLSNREYPLSSIPPSSRRKEKLTTGSENSWIDCLSDFAKLLRTAPNAKKRPVKVAIIDDGVDASLLSLDGKISIGKSFCPYATSTDLLSPYYVPSGNHGTCMATLISKICPEVKLYVARLDERQVPGSSHRQITAKSAADVSSQYPFLFCLVMTHLLMSSSLTSRRQFGGLPKAM